MTVITGQLLSGIGAPLVDDGADGDHYRDIASNVLYYKDGGVWTAVTDFDHPEAGTGTVWVSGEGAPQPDDGEDGNYYRDTLTQIVYFKTAGVWAAIADLDGGPSELVEEQKLWGVDGTPQADMGNDGDFAIDRTPKLMYEKVSGAWVFRGQLGVAGATGTFGMGNGAPAPEYGEPGMFYLDLQTLNVYSNGEGWAIVAQWSGSTTGAFTVGEWAMGGEPAPLAITGDYEAEIGGTAPNVTITPEGDVAEAITGYHVSLGKSPIGVGIDGTGTRSAKLVFPAWTGGDNLNGIGILLVNSGASDADIAKIVVGGTASTAVYGGGFAFYGPTNQAQAITFSGTAPALGDLTTLGQSAGDAIYLTYNAETDKITVALNDGDESGETQLDFDGMVDTSLKLVAFMSFAGAAPVFAAGSIIVVAGTDDNDRLPLTAQAEAVVPNDSNDGDIFQVTEPGIFGNKETKLGDYVQLYNNKTEIIVIRVPGPAEDTGGETGVGTPEFLGEIDLTPQYDITEAVGDILTNATNVSGAQGVQTITPVEPLTTLPGLGAPYNGFAATASSITPPADGNANASLVWPDLSVDAMGAMCLVIHDENVTAGAAVKRMTTSGAGAEMYAMMYYTAMAGGSTAGSASASVSGTSAHSSEISVPEPTAGMELIFGLNADGSTYLRTADSSYNETLAPFPINDMPDGTKLKVSVLFFTNDTSTNVPNLAVDFATHLDDVNPFGVATPLPVELPDGAKDGDFLKCIAAGTFGTQAVLAGEYFVLTLDTTDCIVLPGRPDLTGIEQDIQDLEQDIQDLETLTGQHTTDISGLQDSVNAAMTAVEKVSLFKYSTLTDSSTDDNQFQVTGSNLNIYFKGNYRALVINITGNVPGVTSPNRYKYVELPDSLLTLDDEAADFLIQVISSNGILDTAIMYVAGQDNEVVINNVPSSVTNRWIRLRKGVLSNEPVVRKVDMKPAVDYGDINTGIGSASNYLNGYASPAQGMSQLGYFDSFDTLVKIGLDAGAYSDGITAGRLDVTTPMETAQEFYVELTANGVCSGTMRFQVGRNYGSPVSFVDVDVPTTAAEVKTYRVYWRGASLAAELIN